MTIIEAMPLLEELKSSSKEERRAFFKDPDTFKIFWYYHFPQNFVSELAPFHDEWIHAITMTNKSILLEAFRGSLKTEIIKVYLVWCIAYAVEPYDVVQSYDSGWSEEMVRNVAKMLVSQSIVNDYGNLFPFASSKEDMSKKSVTNFDTTNGVKIVSRSLGEKLRGAASYDEETGSNRPTLLILDDIDVMDSVRNVDIIDKNEQKINNETIGAMSKERARIIFLGNTILSDGIVRRFAANKADSEHWTVFRQPLYDGSGKIVWDFFTPAMIEKIRADEGEDAFMQNYLLIPKLLSGTPVFDMKQEFDIQKPYKEIQGFRLFLPPQDDLVIGIDIAEGGSKGDFSAISARNHQGKIVFQLKIRCSEEQLAMQLDFILTQYSEGEGANPRHYLGTIVPENNVGLAFINECKKYPWFQYVLKQRREDSVSQENLVQKYGFRTTAQSKDLIIREYRIALLRKEISITPELHEEMGTYQYDSLNRANAMAPYHDDLLMADMIALNAIIHEPFVAKYATKPVDVWGMSVMERHLHNLRNQRTQGEEE